MKPTCSYSCGQARVYMEVHEPSFRPFADISIVFVAMAKKVVCIRAKWPIMPALITGFSSMKLLGVFLLLRYGMLVDCRVTLSSKFAGTHLYT